MLAHLAPDGCDALHPKVPTIAPQGPAGVSRLAPVPRLPGVPWDASPGGSLVSPRSSPAVATLAFGAPIPRPAHGPRAARWTHQARGLRALARLTRGALVTIGPALALLPGAAQLTHHVVGCMVEG